MSLKDEVVKCQPATAELESERDEITPGDSETISGGAGGFYQNRGTGGPGSTSDEGSGPG